MIANPSPILSARQLSCYFGSLAAVENLSLDLEEGEILGLLGPNGAGKTTTISMLCGFLRPGAGEVLYCGRSIHTDPAARQEIGMCPQSITLWKNLTCLEQLIFIGEMYGLPAGECRRRGVKLLAELELEEKTNKLAGTLSGGMQRRLNLALALVHDPHILILDEPEAGLDPQSRVLVREFVRRWAREPGRSVILTTHNMDEADRMAQRVAIIDHGHLLVVDTPERLKHRLGEGDVLEIELLPNGLAPSEIVAALCPVAPQTTFVEPFLTVRARGVMDLLPVIIAALQKLNVHTGDVRLRASTLEDVFISLTGRKLRE